MKSLLFTITFYFISLGCQGIVIRHDVQEESYHAGPEAFPPLATFLIDGAHGTLIKPDWVVTAAHATFCASPGSFVLINGKAHKIKALYVHPDYQTKDSHDIALVQLESPVDNVQPATPYTQTDEKGMDVWFVGIGGTGHGLTGETIDNAANNGLLRQAQNKVSDTQEASLMFVFDQGLNALPLEGVSGNGDSGGPAFIKTPEGFELVGVSSRFDGDGIGQYNITEYYSRVSYFREWMEQIMSGDDSQRSQLSDSRLIRLPSGLTEEILPMVCEQITIKEDSTDIVKFAE